MSARKASSSKSDPLAVPLRRTMVADSLAHATVGVRPPDLEMSLRLGMALTRATAVHPDIQRLAAEVQNLLRPRSALHGSGRRRAGSSRRWANATSMIARRRATPVFP
jgi:hypothetical protein